MFFSWQNFPFSCICAHKPVANNFQRIFHTLNNINSWNVPMYGMRNAYSKTTY